MERSALARHRKRRLQLDAMQHASAHTELKSVRTLAAATHAAHAGVSAPLADAVNDAISVLRNVKNSVYHRALAARALGLLVVHDSGLSSRLRMESEELVDALLQVVNFCRHSRVQNADTRRIHVNCCLVISLVMQAPHKNLHLLVSLDSELLVMSARPSERDSASLFLTVAGRPETGAPDTMSATTTTATGSLVAAHNVASSEHGLAGHVLGAVRGGKRSKPPRRHRGTLPQASNQEMPLPVGRRIAWTDEPSDAAARAQSPLHRLKQSPTKLNGAAGSVHPHKKALRSSSPPPPPPPLQPNRSSTPAVAAALAAASNAVSSHTPSRVFKMERFRVITPALAHASSAAGAARLTPLLPVIRPTREPPSSADAAADAIDDSDTDARVEVASPAVPPTSASLLHPTHMLEVFRSKRMPLASPAFFARHVRDGAVKSNVASPPNRLHVLDWSEWQQRGLTEETVDSVDVLTSPPAAAAANYERLDAAAGRPASPIATQRVTAAGPSRKRLESTSAMTTKPVESITTATTVQLDDRRTDLPTDDLDSRAYKQQRLREILHSPVTPNEAAAAHLRTLAQRVNTSFMVSLGAEIDALRRDEQHMRSALHAQIAAEREQLPLQFLFQLPGGAAYCRHRMRRAMALWVLMFEDNQRRLALLQWKAFVEHCRYADRGHEYQRLAATKRLRVAIDFVLRGYLAHALEHWIDATRQLIWRDRDAAARYIQTQARRYAGRRRLLALHDAAPVGSCVLRDVYLAPYRGLTFELPPRVRAERRAIWRAAERVQSACRRRRFRVCLARYRRAATTIQAQQRMRAARSRYRALRRHIVAFQATVRMLRHRGAYRTLRTAAVLVQRSFRSVRVRRLRRLVLCAQRRQQERQISIALLAQRLVRGFLARCSARAERQQREAEFNAALVVQRCWYRRNNEWSTFLLLGCLRVQESAELAFAVRVRAYSRQFMARRIRRAWCAFITAKRNAAALAIQCAMRRHLAQRVVQYRRDCRMAHRRIKWFLRVRHAERMRMATRVQFAWLRAAPGRLARHLQQQRLVRALCNARVQYVRDAHAAAVLQALVRGHNARVVARRERSVRTLQRVVRAFLRWRRLQREVRRIKRVVAERLSATYIAAGCNSVFVRRLCVLATAATEIQRRVRGALSRSALTRSIVLLELRTRMACCIQRRWRRTAHLRIAKRLRAAQHRRLTNPFAALASVRAVLAETLRCSSMLFDPSDELRGMALATWLRRLGLDTKYFECLQRHTRVLLANSAVGASANDGDSSDAGAGASDDVLRVLRGMDKDACRQQLAAMGVDDDNDRERMITSLFAKQTIAAAAQQRHRIDAARAVHVAQQRKCDAAQLQLHKRETHQRDAETALAAVLDEMTEFRNPPSALRRQREQCAQSLETALLASAEAQRVCAAAATLLAAANHALATEQQQLRDVHEPREVAAVYSIQSLALVADRNSVRARFLAHFPGLEARALAFATALDDDAVSTWQLEQFFATHTSAAAVKTHMATLTHFTLETATTTRDNARFADCAELLQYGVERVCELLAVPIEVVALGRTDIVVASNGISASPTTASGLLYDALIATIASAHRAPRVLERVKTWRRGVDALEHMDAMALRVQTLWRRRAAAKLLEIVRARRGRERVLAAYVAEAHTDYVTPIWAADREREQHELDAWLDEQARVRRRARLDDVVRFPYIAHWDASAQMYYYFSSGEDTEDGAIQQYALDRKPVYSIEEEDAAVVIQAAVRALLARLEALALARQQRRQLRRDALEAEWNRTHRERAQAVTLSVNVRVTPNRTLALWLEQRRRAARQRTASAASSSDIAKPKSTPATAGSGKSKPRAAAGNRKVRTRNSGDRDNINATDAAPPMVVSDADAAWSKRVDAIADGPLAAAYHRSVRAEHRRDWTFPAHSRPLNAHALALVALLEQYSAFTAAVAPTASSVTTLRYTRGPLRFGWREVRGTGDSGAATQPYYYHRASGETTWERPEYAFEHEFAVTCMQTLARVVVARNAFARVLASHTLVDTVQHAVQTASTLGWIGFGLEGLSTAVFLHRWGLAKYVPALAHASIDDVLALSDARVKKLAWTKEEVALLRGAMAEQRLARCRATKYPLSAAVNELATVVGGTRGRHPFAIVPSERLVHQLVAQSLANQHGRVPALVQAVRASSTPISFRQLDVHLRRFAGRPDDALRGIGEIASLACATQAPQERAICRLYVRAAARCVVLAANQQLRTLQCELSAVLVAAARLLGTGQDTEDVCALATTMPLSPEVLACATAEQQHDESGAISLVDEYVQTALARYPTRLVKGLWETDPSQATSPRFSLAQTALYVREAALERVLQWVRSAVLAQAMFRMHIMRRWYVATLAFRAHAATQLQCAWRMRIARDALALLASQQQSDYEQCFDAQQQTFYYVYTPTRETLNDEPRDDSGAVLAFRPMVQDRVTKRWVRAWPHFDKASLHQREATNDIDASSALAGPLCSICHVERAARRCNECYARTGDYVDYCLVCFFEHHAAENAATSWHTYTALHSGRATRQHLHCIECRRFATRRCLQCDEHYCDRCFQRVHGRGHTRTAHRCELYAPMARVCVECEARVAVQLCLVCGDALCEDCVARTHSRGARALHATKLLKQPLEPTQVYCEQCHARCGDAQCAYCARALCCVCAGAKHALLCPETELELTRAALLGDHVCVECGKPADRECATCGDRYCSVRWMGNAGCFERFHAKGKRADHVAVACAPPAMTPELLELEARVKRKRKQDAEDAEAEAKRLAAEMLTLAAAAAVVRPVRTTSNNRKKARAALRGGARRCSVDQCATPALSDAVAFCAKHFTLQHALEATQGDPLEAAKLLAQIEQTGRRLVAPSTVFGSTLLGSLLQRSNTKEAKAREAGERGARAKKPKRSAKKRTTVTAEAARSDV